MTTMPDVAGGWLRSLLGALGGISGGKLYILGVAGLDTPIWDVLAPEGKREEAEGRLRTGSRSPASQLGKRYQPGSRLLLGSLGSVFHRKKNI
jgi:hypothetical protein